MKNGCDSCDIVTNRKNPSHSNGFSNVERHNGVTNVTTKGGIQVAETIITHQIQVEMIDLPDRFIQVIMNDLTLRNPAYDQAVRQGRNVYSIPEFIELYRTDNGVLTIPRGYGKKLIQRLQEHGVQVQWRDQRLMLANVKFHSSIRLRDYQESAVKALLKSRQGGVVAPCGAGKTMILLEAMVRIGQPALWVTHTTELAEQVIKRACEVLNITEDEIGRIYGGQMTVGERFTVALVQSLSKIDMEAIRDKFGAILVDEAHHMAATTFFHPVGQFPAMYRLWASATPERSDGLTEMVFAGAGPILYEIEQAAVPTIIPRLEVIETDFATHDEDYTKLIGALIGDEQRNHLVARTIAQQAVGHFSLVLSDRIEHLETLRALLKEMLPDLTIEVLTGSLKKSERVDVMDRMQSKQIDILLATQLAREGLDIKHLDRLFLTTPKRAAGAVQQEVGRVMRPDAGKQDAVVFDFWDSRSPILKAQFWKRREVYRRLGMGVEAGRRRAVM